MKIIDLLNKIAKGEEVPKLIKYEDCKYIYKESENHYERTDTEEYLFYEYDVIPIINDEVEILEEVEDKGYEDIEELDVALLGQCDNWLRCSTNEVTKQDIELNPYIINNVRENTLEFQRKINALIRNQKKILERLDK